MSRDRPAQAFQRAAFSLRVPGVGAEKARQPKQDADLEEKKRWMEGLVVGEERSGAYYDEKLLCVCELSLDSDPTLELGYHDFVQICEASQITATCSFLKNQQPSKPAPISTRRVSSVPLARNRRSSTTPTLSTIAEAKKKAPSSLLSVRPDLSGAGPPVTPNPMPSTKGADERYAGVEGPIVWEGGLRHLFSEKVTPADGPTVLEVDISGRDEGEGEAQVVKRWTGLWVGYIPLSFADMAIDGAQLGVTATITLRTSDVPNLASRRGSVVTKDGVEVMEDDEEPKKATVSTESLKKVDLLQGLGGGDILPSTRLKHLQDPPHVVHTHILPRRQSSATMTKLVSQTSDVPDAAFGAAVVRKSFRAVLPVLSALQIRMRTLPSIPTMENRGKEDTSIGGTPKGTTMICIEAELGPGMEALYELEDLEVMIGGRRKAGLLWAEKAEGLQQPDMFPLSIARGEQHNFVFKFEPPSGLADYEVGQEQVRIEIKGRVAEPIEDSGEGYKTDVFSAVWNSIVDLRALALPTKTAHFDSVLQDKDDGSRTPKSSMLTPGMRSVYAGAGHMTANTERARVQSARYGNRRTDAFPPEAGNMGELQRDLIISASVVPPTDPTEAQGNGEVSNEVKTFQPFMVEVIFLNLADEVLKLMVAVSLEQADGGGRQQTVIPLEAEVKLTPLQPRACQAVRLRCMPIGPGILDLPAVEVYDLGRGISARADFGLRVRAS